jgi:hypothetical protein
MSKLIVALIAGVFATGVLAQATTTGSSKDMSKQGEVQKATEAGTTNSLQQREAQSKEVKKLKGEKGTPKALTGKKEKQEAAASATQQHSEGSLKQREEQSAEVKKLKGEKGQPKALTTKQQKQQAVESETKKNASP